MSWLRPARSQAKKWMMEGGDRDVVADLDAILVQTVEFRLHGKVHTLKALNVEEFLLFTNALAKVYELKNKDHIHVEELITRYHEMISSVCDTISIEEVRQMNQVQIGALFQLILDTFQGKAQAEAERESKKKALLIQSNMSAT